VLKQALDLSPVATIIVDLKSPGHPVVFLNSAFEALSGYDASELIGMSWDELQVNYAMGPHDGDTVARVGETAILECHPRLGAVEQLILEMMPLYDRPGAPRFWMGAELRRGQEQAEVADSERETLLAVLRDARMQLRRLDGRDSATGVLNRRAFDEMLQRDWVIARREQRQLSLILFRVDALADYREVFGRHAADACLRKVLHAITGSMRRAGDVVARFADDRFIVLLNGCEAEDVMSLAGQIAERVRHLSIHHPRSMNGRFVTVSHGMATELPGASGSPEKLIAVAEESLGQAAPDASAVNAG
jgi:diguanylate cyclase (GGDEF)-like protein